jgi:putative oxidoreductase
MASAPTSSPLPSPSGRISAADLGLLIIRLALAAVFIYHGSQKLFGAFGGPGIEGFTGFLKSLNVPMPEVSAWLAALAEFVGGIILVLGTGTRLAVIPMIITMIVAIVKVHPSAFSAQNGGMEYPLVLGSVLLGLLLIGPGRITIGRLLGGK